jgi:hypothetical protein
MCNDAQAPVACTLNQQDLEQQSERWQALADRAGRGVSRTDRGLRLTFSAGPGVVAELDELAELERECCAFASWSVTSEADRVVLDVSGDDEVAVAAVQVMFDPLRWPSASHVDVVAAGQ